MRSNYCGQQVSEHYLFDTELVQRSFNAVFGKVVRCASKEVIIELLTTKCLQVYFMAQKHVQLTISVLRSLKFVTNNAFRKIFSTKSYVLPISVFSFLIVLCLTLCIKEKLIFKPIEIL